MIKNCLFLFCVLFVVGGESSCVDDFFKCFSEFTDSFFRSNAEHVNATADKLPEGYKQVKDIDTKSIENFTSVIQSNLFKNVQSDIAKDIVVTDNPKTKIYVKTFTYDFGDLFPDFGGFNFGSDDNEEMYDTLIQHELEIPNYGTAKYGEEISTQNGLSIKTKMGIEPVSTKDNSSESKQAHDTETKTETKHKSDSITTTPTEKPDMTVQQIYLATDLKEGEQKPNKNGSTTSAPLKHIKQKVMEKTPNPVNVTNNIKVSISNTEIKSEYKTIQTTQRVQTKAPTDNTNQSTKSDLSTATVIPIHTGKQFEKDIRENLIEDDEDNDYSLDDSTDYPKIDYIVIYKDTTNEENVYVATDKPESNITNIMDDIVENVEEYSLEIETGLDINNTTTVCHGNTSAVSNIFPWIATIFIKNDTANQFQYTCDGALLSDKLLITAARCFTIFDAPVNPDDVLVFLGKRSLQSMGEGERNVRISKIILHSNFSQNGQVVNDMALLTLEEPTAFTDDIRPACLGGDDGGKSATTAWAPSGSLTPVLFVKTSASCDVSEGTFCATYGNEVALCPSYGGIFARRHLGRWSLQGIRSGDVADRGICFSKDVLYTPLDVDWIMEYME